MARWDNPGVPHKGWTLVGYEDIKEDAIDDDFEYETCKCATTNEFGMSIFSHIRTMTEKFELAVTVPAK